MIDIGAHSALGGEDQRDERTTVHGECEGARLGKSEQSRVRIRVLDEEIEQYNRVYYGHGIVDRMASRWSRDAERAGTGGVWLGTAGKTDDGGVVNEWGHKTRNVVFFVICVSLGLGMTSVSSVKGRG